jgi:hypothetical protein
MGEVKNKLIEIQEYLENGYDAEDTATILDVPIGWVQEAMKQMVVEYNHSEIGTFE